jgi:uncharacterized damage-inducible protein DinB
MTLSTRLLPELEAELAKTRKILAAVPDGHNDFAAHPKSMPLTRLAGHTAELPGFAYFMLTRPGIDMQTPEDPRKILRMSTREELLAEYDPLVIRLVDTLKALPDPAWDETFTLSRKGTLMRAASRYETYRGMFLDHMIHHRAQLGVYLRLLEIPVPGTFGPTADDQPPPPNPPTAA